MFFYDMGLSGTLRPPRRGCKPRATSMGNAETFGPYEDQAAFSASSDHPAAHPPPRARVTRMRPGVGRLRGLAARRTGRAGGQKRACFPNQSATSKGPAPPPCALCGAIDVCAPYLTAACGRGSAISSAMPLKRGVQPLPEQTRAAWPLKMAASIPARVSSGTWLVVVVATATAEASACIAPSILIDRGDSAWVGCVRPGRMV